MLPKQMVSPSEKLPRRGKKEDSMSSHQIFSFCLILFMLILVLTLLQSKLFGKRVHYQ